MNKHLLILDDDQDFARSLAAALRRDYSIEIAHSAEDVRELFTPGMFDAALLDLRLEETAGPSGGLGVLSWLKEQDPVLPVLMMTAYGDVGTAVESLKLGAEDFIEKSRFSLDDYRRALDRLFEQGSLRRRARNLEKRLERLEPLDFIGEDGKLQITRKLIDLVAQDGTATVLIRGETGTGKELVAQAIHRRGVRSAGPFVVVAVPALPESTVESELFGHERGAFTGATQRRIGLLEEAREGVLLLDEIGDLPLETQVKLLRFLESREITRLGSNRRVAVDVQVLAATHRPLEELVAGGRFREDLYYRIKGFEISLPPLRERRGDISLLARHFLDLLVRQARTPITRIAEAALEVLTAYSWPGNVRELKQAVGYAALRAKLQDARELRPEHLPPEVAAAPAPRSGRPVPESGPPSEPLPAAGIHLPRLLAETELRYVGLALERASKAEVVRLLGYHDRFALRRRVQGIFATYPELAERFPEVHRAFRKRTPARTE